MNTLSGMLQIMIVVAFGVAAIFNILWVIKSSKHHPRFAWIKILNIVVCLLWVGAQTFSIVVQSAMQMSFDYSWFSVSVLRPINALTGLTLAVGAIARLQAYSRVADEDVKWIIL